MNSQDSSLDLLLAVLLGAFCGALMLFGCVAVGFGLASLMRAVA